MPSYTPNFNLYKPSRMDNEEVDVTLTQNFEKIDTELKNQSDTLTTHKSAPTAHQAENIAVTYDGSPTNVKNALDNMDQRINNIIANAGDSNPEIVDARGEFPVLGMRLQNNESQLTDNATSIRSHEAKSDGSDSLTPIKNTIVASKEVIIPDGAYTILNELPITKSVNIHGKKGSTVTNTNTTSTGDMSIQADDVSLESFSLDGKSTVQGIYTGSVKRFKVNKSKLKSAKHAIHINAANVEDVDIVGNDISADSYAILTNENAKNGKNINILFNKLHSKTADGVELNNPSSSTVDTWKQAKIIGNTINAGEFGTNPNAGFAIGVAKTRDVVVLGNIVEKSRLEALHIEDDQENVLVVGNVFNGCMKDGTRILLGGFSTTGQGKPVIVTNNHFVKQGSKAGNGIYRVYDVAGQLDSNFANNYVRGFDVGLWMDGKGFANVDGCMVDDCNIGIKAGEQSNIAGTIYAKNTPTLVQGLFGSIIEKVIAVTPPTKILEFSGPNGMVGATLKSFIAPTGTKSLINGQANVIPLFVVPSILKGRLTVKGGVNSNKLFLTCDVSWDGTTFTVSNLLRKTAGIFGGSPTIINDNGSISLSVYMGGNLSLSFTYDFDGTYYAD